MCMDHIIYFYIFFIGIFLSGLHRLHVLNLVIPDILNILITVDNIYYDGFHSMSAHIMNIF